MKRVLVGIAGASLATLLMVQGVVGQCCGDCNGDGQVTVDEILTSVNRALSGCRNDSICSTSGGQRLPATGQTTCWDANGNVISCTGTGQDGDIRAGGALAYIDNGDGTITDRTTGLMWEKLSSDGSIHDYGNSYTWDDAFAVKVATLNSTNFAGHTDWRLPNVKELQSIVNYQNSIPAESPAFNTGCLSGCTSSSCSCTQPNSYWSSTTYLPYPTNAWNVYFPDGNLFNGTKSFDFYVRAVRGGL
jgi:hypothetical protein